MQQTVFDGKRWVRLFLVVLCIFYSFTCLSLADNTYSVRHFGVDNGLKSNQTVRVFQDTRGYHWFGSLKGVQRTDGYNFREFPIISTLPSVPVNYEAFKFFLTADSTLLVGTSLGLLQFDALGNQFIHIPFPNTNTKYRVIDICAINDTLLFINSVNDKGVCVYNTRQMSLERSSFPDQTIAKDCKVRMLVKGPDDTYFVVVGFDLYQYDIHKNTSHKCNRGELLPNISLHYGVTDAYGVFWLLTEAGLYYKAPGKALVRLRAIDQYCPLDKQIGSGISLAPDGSLFVGFDWWGVMQIAVQTKTIVTTIRKEENQLNELTSNNVYSLYASPDNALWVGSDGAYLLTKDTSGWQFLKSGKTPLTTNYSVLDILEDSHQNVWVATDGGGLHRYSISEHKTEPVTKMNGKNLPASKVIMCLHEDRITGDLWIGTYGDGLYRYQPSANRSEHFMHKIGNSNGVQKNNIWDIAQDRTGNLLVSSYCQSISILDKYTKRWTQLSVENGQLRGNCVMRIEADVDGDLWLGYMGEGFDLYDQQRRAMTDGVKSSSGIINAICFDGDTVWTAGSRGLSAYSKRMQKFVTVPVCKSLEQSKIQELFKDSRGRYWVATTDGLFYFYSSDTLPTYSRLDSYFENNTVKCITETSDGRLLFGGINGLLSVPVSSASNHYAIDFDIHLTDFRLFGKSHTAHTHDGTPVYVDDVTSIELPYDQNYLGFSFSTIKLVGIENIQYSVRVSNYYPQWQDLEASNNRLDLPNLQPETYRVEIKASPKGNDKLHKIRTFTIIIHPPFWKSWWFKALISMLVVVAAGLYNLARSRAMRKENERLELLVAQRTDTLRKAIDNINETKLVMEMKNEELQESLSMKDKLIGVIGHDFKNPLGAISNLLHVIKMKKDKLDPQMLDQYLDLAEQSSQRLSEQMLMVLDWAQGKAGEMVCKPVEINLELLLTDTIQLLQENARLKNIQITVQAEYATNALVDARMMSTVIRNLLQNALKFTPRGGAVLVMIHEDDTMLELSVIDTGIGMTEEKATQLFAHSHGTLSTYGTDAERGTGLGLQICKSFVEKNGGTISAKSSEGKGSVFTVLLPKGNTPATKTSFAIQETIMDNETASDDDNNNKYSVLLVDDNPELVEILNQALVSNFTVITALDGQQGLHLAQNMLPDIIICDINLPRINGLDLCRAIKDNALTMHIPVILVTGEKSDTIEADSFHCGASDFVAKPFNSLSLKHKITSLLHHINRNNAPAQGNLISGMFVLPESADDVIIKKIIEMMNENFGNATYDVDTIATKIGLSRTQLWRKTKNTLGKTPSELISGLRLQKAAEMLRSGKYRVSDIAYAVGFSDPRYFSRCFSKEFGATPTEYAENAHR